MVALELGTARRHRRHRIRRGTAASAGLVVALLVAGAPGGAQDAPPSSTGTSASTTVPTSESLPGPASSSTVAPLAPPVDTAAIATDQADLVKQDHQATIAADQRALTTAQTNLANDQQTLVNDQQQAAATTANITRSTQDQQADQAAQARARADSQAATNAVNADRDRLRTIAVQLYEGPPTPVTENLQAGGGTSLAAAPSLGVSDQLQQAQEDDAGQVYFADAIDSIDRTTKADLAHQVQTAQRLQQLTAAVSRDDSAVTNAHQQASTAAAALQNQQGVVAHDTQAAAAAEQQLTTDQNDLDAALAALAGPPLARPRAAGDTSPTILGPSVLTPAQLVSWFNAQGYVDSTSTPVQQFAQLYLSEGQAEGVRGDIAFAQAVLETGGFSSPDALTADNYAGIGHCDTCAAGLAFPSPQLGVRGHIQLLRAYANPALTSAQLANPPAIAQVAPEGQFVRGCCGTWQSLTGVWASSPIYGNSILSLYLSMLTSALAGLPAGGRAPPATAGAPPPALAPPAS